MVSSTSDHPVWIDAIITIAVVSFNIELHCENIPVFDAF
jgi:hypothetical protein